MSAEKHSFQAEIQQLLDIVIHSLYTDKDIFVRELISNAADALEKLRFRQASGAEIRSPELPLKISLTTDEEAKTITFADTGIGMTRDELVQNLGTIARSGSKEFMKQLAEAKDRSADIIGQFGVGFYSSFMVADSVEVFSRAAAPDSVTWRWSSTGAGTYEIEEAGDLERGTKIVVHLKEEHKDFAQKFTIEELIKRYSSFVPFPIELNGEQVNKVQALWIKGKNEIKEEEYNEFYHFIGHDHQDPRYRLHFTADAPLSIKALLFVPKQSLERMGLTRHESEVNLYCRKVLIQPKAKGLFPEWLRFLKGVVDSEDLPLNISRESMQDSSLLAKLNQVLTTRFLKFLNEEALANPENYLEFFNEFGHALKEGVWSDYTHREALGKLLRYESSATEPGKFTSLAEYVGRMAPEQKDIYFVLAPSREAAEANPHYEVFRERKLEVLFMFDPRDEFVMEHLRNFDTKDLKSAEKADLALEKEGDDKLDDEAAKTLAAFIKETLGDRVAEVKTSKRLVDSPAVVAESDPYMTSSMRRLMKAMNKDKAGADTSAKPNLEINPHHPLLRQLAEAREKNPEVAKAVAETIFDNALLAAGLLEDPRHLLKRVAGLMEKALAG